MKTALVIDDDPIVLTVIARTLEEAGWRVFEANDGDRAVELAVEHRPDVIVCDLRMPRFNGYQVCRAIRSNQSFLPQPRIVVISSSNYAADRTNSIEAGADDFLLKPIKPAELLHILELERGTTFIRKTPAMSKGATPRTLLIFAAPSARRRPSASGACAAPSPRQATQL